MKIKLHSKLIYRVPKYAHDATLAECWEDLKGEIKNTSAHFYQQIKSVGIGELDSLSEKTRYTIWKYFNRARLRPVPYGGYVGIGMFEWQLPEMVPPVILAEQQDQVTLMDWSQIDHDELNQATVNDDTLLFANSTYYPIPEGIRYLSHQAGAYEIVENLDHPLVLEILTACKSPIPFWELKNKLGSSLSTSEQQQFVEHLVSLQLLFTNDYPNIIGEENFILKKIIASEADSRYHLATRSYVRGGIKPSLLRHLPALVQWLHSTFSVKDVDALSRFKENFNKRFEGQQLPLMHVLDPELGIGYEALEQSIGTDDFIMRLAMKVNSNEKDDPINKIKLALSQNVHEADTIDIERLFPKQDIQPSLLPNTTSAMFQIAGDLVVIDQLGGITATSLLGRFTHADETIHAHCRDLAIIEANANPDVVFFDIAYQVKDRIDNINRRKSIFSHQLSILDFDTSTDPISLSDIYISIEQNTIVLWSKKLNKRLVPRMASAYNYTKSDLPLFRLLCDLQHQGVKAYHQFDLQAILPGLAYYPRLQFRNLILSPAKWIVKGAELFKNGLTNGNIGWPREYLRSIGITGFFKSGFSDQTLCFHLEDDGDMESFLRYADKLSRITIEEVLMGEEPVVKDEMGRPYVAQFIASVLHHEEIYRSPITIHDHKENNVQRMFAPGSEWIYFEIYCHTQRMKSLLLDYVAPFAVSMKGAVESWFFIRYQNEDGPHLRVRFKVYSAAQAPMVITEFSAMLNDQLSGGMIADLLLRTYKRELERYGKELVGFAEYCFYLDTNFIVTLLRSELSDHQLYQMSLMVLERVGSTALLSQDSFEKLITNVSRSFTEEHHLGSAEFKALNEAFQAFSKLPNPYLDEEQYRHMDDYCKGLIALLEQAEESVRSSLLTSMFHMHVNRLYSSHQRTHEMILYYLYFKKFQRGKFSTAGQDSMEN